jgi:enamine deaminase RidA (YjgF/YER057c/UK114 family)
VIIGQTLYLSGTIGLDPKTGQFAGEDVQEQARQVDLYLDLSFFVFLVIV